MNALPAPSPSGRPRPSRQAHRKARVQPCRRRAGAAFRVRVEPLPDAAQLDLNRFTEETRRTLYQLAVAAYWLPGGEADEYEVPTFSPEEAGLSIEYFHRRWFVTWTDLDQPESAPVEDRQPLLHIERNDSWPLGLSFSPCTA
jgi:hypothetical protein